MSTLNIPTLDEQYMWDNMVEVASDDLGEETLPVGPPVVANTPIATPISGATCPNIPQPTRIITGKICKRVKKVQLPITELTLSSEQTPGHYFIVLGLPDRPTVRAIVEDKGELFVYLVDCLATSGFKKACNIILRLAERFGEIDHKLMAYTGVKAHFKMCNVQEAVRVLELYMGICRTDTVEFKEVIRRLNNFVN